MNDFEDFEGSADETPAELSVLLSHIIAFQEEGRICYLVVGKRAERISPDDSEQNIVQFWKQLHGQEREEAYVTDTAPDTAALTESNREENNNLGSVIKKMLRENPISTINDINQFTRLQIQYLGEPIWFAYEALLKKLPKDLPKEKVEALVAPMLEAGDVPHVPRRAEEYLRSIGYSEEQIGRLYSKENRDRRRAMADFRDSTDVSPRSIHTIEELHEAISKQRAGSHLHTYCSYLQSLDSRTPASVVDGIVLPLCKHESYEVKKEAEKTLKRLRPDTNGK